MNTFSKAPAHPEGMTTAQNRVHKGVPTGGQFAASAHGEASIDLSTDPWGALTQSAEQIRAQAYAEGRKQGFTEAAEALFEWRADLADEISGFTLGSGYYSFRVGPDDAREMTESVIEQARTMLQARGNALDEEPMTPSPVQDDWLACRGCGQSGYATTYDGQDLGACTICNGHGAVPPTPLGQDAVEVPGHGTFHRRRDGVYPGTPYAMRFEANRPLTDDEMQRMAALIGYRYRATVRGESLGWPARDSAHSFVLAADTTKSRSDDLGFAMEAFEDDLIGIIHEGSPVRTTNRSGAGTQGTRLVEGIDDPDLNVSIYYDDVITPEENR